MLLRSLPGDVDGEWPEEEGPEADFKASLAHARDNPASGVSACTEATSWLPSEDAESLALLHLPQS